MKYKIWAVFIFLMSGFTFSNEIKLKSDTFKVLKYKGIASHKFSETEKGLKVEVKSSANPMIYKFEKASILKEVEIKLKVIGELKLKESLQGEKKNDDFRFRIGLVYEGDHNISSFQKLFAPEWLKELFKLGEGYKGVDRIQFYTTYQDKRIADKSRDHYFSEYLKETHNLKIDSNGFVSHRLKPEADKRVLGFWIAIDGDDTESEFSVELQKLSYKKVL